MHSDDSPTICRDLNPMLNQCHTLALSVFAATILDADMSERCTLSERLASDSRIPLTPLSIPENIIKTTCPRKLAKHPRPSCATDDPLYQRSKPHKARGVEQKFICGYCKRVKSSTSSCSDGRVRIRCECGGQHSDGKPRMHATWTPVDGPVTPTTTTGGLPQLPTTTSKAPPRPVTPPPAAMYSTHNDIVFVDETEQQGRPTRQRISSTASQQPGPGSILRTQPAQYGTQYILHQVSPYMPIPLSAS